MEHDVRLKAGDTPISCNAFGSLVCQSELTLTGKGFWTDDDGRFLVGQVMEQHPGAGVHMAVTIPEPGTYVMMLAGLGLLGFIARRRTQNAA